jgi:ribose transport system substrate-binding protein
MHQSNISRANKVSAFAAAAIAVSLVLTSCSTGTGKTAATAAVSKSCVAGTPFSTDDAKDSINYTDLESKLGAVPAPKSSVKIGSIMKFLGNQYWIALGDGQSKRAGKYKIAVDVQAATSESDQIGQLNSAETMLQKNYTAMLVSPQTDTNLCAAVEKAEKVGIPILNVNDAVLPNAQHWVGPNQIQNGISAADFVVKKVPAGSQVAVIEGQAGVYAARQRTAGFTTTATKGGLKVVASVPGDWDVSKARDAAATIIKQYPNLAAFYANNDGMALGVAEAVKAAGLKGKILVIGTDGIEDAYKAIRTGDLTATVDSYPFLTGQVSVDIALRLLGGQTVPRAVYTPQALITAENVDAAAPALP